MTKHFWKVVRLGLLIFGVIFAISMIGVLIYVFTVMVPAIVSNPAGFTANQSGAIAKQSPFSSVFVLLSALGSLLFYVILAPAILENKGAVSSIRSGLLAVKRNGRTFLSILILFVIASAIILTVSTGLLSTMRFAHLFSSLLAALLSPFWFLVSFRFYSESAAIEPLGNEPSSNVQVSKACHNCKAKIPSGDMYCVNCGAKQT